MQKMGVGARGSLLVVAAAVAIAVTVSPAGLLSFEGSFSEQPLEPGEGGLEQILHAELAVLRSVRGGVVKVAPEDALAVFVVLPGEQDVGVPHLVHVPRRNDLLILEEAELQEAPVPLRRF